MMNEEASGWKTVAQARQGGHSDGLFQCTLHERRQVAARGLAIFQNGHLAVRRVHRARLRRRQGG
jgi:hypothetical protein